jgi:hypothetical protein
MKKMIRNEKMKKNGRNQNNNGRWKNNNKRKKRWKTIGNEQNEKEKKEED